MKYIICHNSYSAFIDDCERRRKLGQKQAYCGTCCLLRWPDECEHPKKTQREFNAMVRASKKIVERLAKDRAREVLKP